MPDVDQQFPRPLNGFFFEIIAEGPVAEHFEERMMVRIKTDLFQIVVLSAGADTFLRVGHPRVFRRLLPEKIRHERVHAGIGKEQIRCFRKQRIRRNDAMMFAFEKFQETLPNFMGTHVFILYFRGFSKQPKTAREAEPSER